MSEHIDYRSNLEQILTFTSGKQMLSIRDVQRFTGMEYRTVKKKFPFVDHYISAATLARCLCGGDER